MWPSVGKKAKHQMKLYVLSMSSFHTNINHVLMLFETGKLKNQNAWNLISSPTNAFIRKKTPKQSYKGS